ncbi:uncharacterized protein (TIGR02246 family) [Spirosoma lacussanchae]|uniref:nuclear transport factor 2 family protein n=1 Tax=Spirosoma lacussanchae TaxID=1884249 RepID=UPI001108E4D8|nr:nuclear transport factor 2 family protein [Spirosoma lacussanchae]
MTENNKALLLKGNAAIAEGNYEGFLALCTDDTEWTFVGDTVLKGKEAVRQWMATNYTEPPLVTVEDLLAEGDFLVAVGSVTMKNENGNPTHYAYSDVWRFRDGKLAELRAFVINIDPDNVARR